MENTRISEVFAERKPWKYFNAVNVKLCAFIATVYCLIYNIALHTDVGKLLSHLTQAMVTVVVGPYTDDGKLLSHLTQTMVSCCRTLHRRW